MKWLKDIFRKEKPSDKAGCFGLNDLEKWLDEKSRDPDSEKRLKDIYSRIEKLAEDLTGDVKALSKAAPGGDTPPKLLKAGLAARDAVANQINSLSERLTPPEEVEAANVAEYHSSLVRTLGKTITMFGRSQQYVSALFPKEAESINERFNRLSHLLVELDGEIGERRKIVSEINASKEVLQRLRKECAKIGDINGSIGSKEKSLEELRDSDRHVQEELEMLAASEEGREAQKLKAALSESRNELSRIEVQMADLIAPLNKAIARIVKQDASDRIDLQHRKAFELLSKSPAEALNSDISEPLLELKSKIDLLGIKDKKREKIAEQIDCLIREKPLAALKAKHSETQKQINNLEEMLQKSCLKAFKLEEEQSRIISQISRIEADLAQDKERLAALKERAAGDKVELLAKIAKQAGRPVEIDIGEL